MGALSPKEVKKITVADLFDGVVKEYSIYACHRNIPNVMDGFKPSQRKVMFGALKIAGTIPEEGIKVSGLAAAVTGCAAYHHGEASLESAITNMAQDFAGANNINYLEPNGSFGSRLGPDPASSRYIFTSLMPSFRAIFKREDDDILEHILEEGQVIEPRFYLPILPNVLINGADGMGTGFATKIMMYNPLDLKTYIVNKLKGKPRDKNIKLLPWFKGFRGTVEREGTHGVIIKGKFERLSTTKLLITELPIGTYQDSYKATLLDLLEPTASNGQPLDPFIKDYDNRSTHLKFEFELTVPRTTSYETDEVLMKKFKLVTKLKENFILWLENGKLWRFDGPEDICEYFVDERLKYYEKRRQKRIEVFTDELSLLNEKIRFIEYYIGSSRQVSSMTRAELEAVLTGFMFKNISTLLEIRIYNLTKDQIEKLRGDAADVEAKLKYYQGTTAADIYLKDLEELNLKKYLEVPA